MAPENLDLWQNLARETSISTSQPHKATKEKRDPTQDMQSWGQGEGRGGRDRSCWVSTGQALGTSTWSVLPELSSVQEA